MYSINNKAVAEKIESSGRVFGIWLVNTASGEMLTGDTVFGADSESQSTSLSDDIELGAICSQSWTVQLTDTAVNYTGQEFALYLYLKDISHGATAYGDLKRYSYGQLRKMPVAQIKTLGEIIGGELIPMGVYACIRCKKNGGEVDLTLYDKLYFSDKTYNRAVRLPAMASEIEDDVCRQLCVVNGNTGDESALLRDKYIVKLFDKNHSRLRTAGFDFLISTIPKGTTMRQMLSYIASAKGQAGVLDRHGRYVRKWYGNSVKTLDRNTIDLPTLSEKPNRVVGVICRVSDSQTMTVGETGENAGGRVIEFDNPYMTESLLKSIFRRLKRLVWYTADVCQRLGDPRFEVCDTVTYEDNGERYVIPITELSFSFDGGLSANILAVGLNEEEQGLS